MARSNSLGQFARRMTLASQSIGKNTEKAVKRAAVAADQALVGATPVDTGRAKGNWNAAIGAVDDEVTDNTDPGGEATTSENQRTIESWRLGQQAIFLSNSLPYILPLENGSSDHAPNGMTHAGIAAAKRQLGKAKLLG